MLGTYSYNDDNDNNDIDNNSMNPFKTYTQT